MHMESKNKRKIDSIKFKSFCAPEDLINGIERQPTNGKKYLQITYLINNYLAEYKKNS